MGTDNSSHDRTRQHGLVFTDPETTLKAVKRLRAAGFEIADVHSPFPVHGINEAIGLAPTRLPWATFVGGSLGFIIAALLQTWTHSMDWPLNIGGKTKLAIPALVPVTFELIVLLAAFATVGGLLVRSKLRPTSHAERPKEQPIRRVSDDRFVVLVNERDGSFSRSEFDRMIKRLKPEKVLRDRRTQ